MSLSPRLLALRDALTVVDERAPLLERTLPLVTESEANQRDRWGKAKRAKAQRAAVPMALAPTARIRPWLTMAPLVVVLTRIAPRELDDDNAVSAMKACRDGVADALGINDRDPRLVWIVDQRRGTAAVQVSLYAAGTGPNSRESTQPAEMVQSAKRRNGGTVAARTIDSSGGVENDSAD